MKTFLTAVALTAICEAAMTEQELNVVDRTLTCNDDPDCSHSDLDWITGAGKPTSQNDVCCATFPSETWNGSSYVTQKDKLCYSKKILNNSSGFNYYKQAYCDGAFQGLAYTLTASVAIATLLAF